MTEKPSANHPVTSRCPETGDPTGVFGAVHPESPTRPLEVGVCHLAVNGAMNAGSYWTRVPPG